MHLKLIPNWIEDWKDGREIGWNSLFHATLKKFRFYLSSSSTS